MLKYFLRTTTIHFMAIFSSFCGPSWAVSSLQRLEGVAEAGEGWEGQCEQKGKEQVSRGTRGHAPHEIFKF